MAVNSIRELQMMRRNIQMRDAPPEQVAQMLQALLTEAINLQNSGSRAFQKKALDELRQVRKDMIAGQISAGGATSNFVGTFSHVIDQIESLATSNAALNEKVGSSFDAIKGAIPSTDTLVAALMTANPILGYGTKLIRDIAAARKRSSEAAKNEAKRRLEVLRQQEEYISSQLEQTDPVAEEIVEGNAERSAFEETQLVLLEEIRDEIKRLEEMFAKTWDVVDDVEQTMLDQVEQSQENSVNEIDAMREAEELRERNAALSEMDGRYEDTPPIPVPDNVDTRAVAEKKEGGLFDMLLGAPLRGLAGIITGVVAGLSGVLAAFAGGGLIGALLAPFKAVIGFIVGVGKLALKLGSKVLLPAMIIKSLFDFFDGFFNAEEIIGQQGMNLGERVLAGVSNVIAKFIGIFDSIAELFGVDLFDQEGMTKRIYEFLHSIPDKAVELFDKITTTIGETYDAVVGGIVENIKNAVDNVLGFFTKIIDTYVEIYGMIFDQFKKLKDGAKSIPLVGGLFGDDEEESAMSEEEKVLAGIGSELDEIEKEIDRRKAKKKLEQMTTTGNLMRVDDNPVGVMPITTPSSGAAQSIQAAEQKAATNNVVAPMINAPSTNVNNVSNTTMNVGGNTSNQNNSFRRLADKNQLQR